MERVKRFLSETCHEGVLELDISNPELVEIEVCYKDCAIISLEEGQVNEVIHMLTVWVENRRAWRTFE